MYQIDQSGKIEDTAKPTVIAFSNNKCGTVIISAKDKRAIQKDYRTVGKSSNAHKLAITSYRKNTGDYVIGKIEVTKLIKLYE